MSDELQFDEQVEKIFVSVRLRPFNDKATNRVRDWQCVNNDTIVFKNSLPERSMFPAAYTFDRVFDSDCDTAKVYEEGARHIALSVLDGINSSIFAYGQTSSGKTYTMRGITEYAVADIYDFMEKHEERDFLVKFCAMEIYNEVVKDLLSPDSYPLRVLDDPERGTVVEKLTEVTLRDRDHLHELLSICEAQRQIGETSMNETSSRSHQILRLTIESCARGYAGAGNSSILTASVNFVDLAGSERASQTLSAGVRLKEGCHINRSLLTLGTVIRKLSKGKNAHVPYRDSKLTRILQNALGGNARTAVICTMSPERVHVEQSRNTLLFANCAKEVRTNAQVNLIMSDKALVKQLQGELARLEKEIRNLGSGSIRSDTDDVLREKDQLIGQMSKEIEELTWQRNLAQSRIENFLLSVREVEMLKQSSNSSEVANVPCMVDSNIYNNVSPCVPSPKNRYLGLDESPEDFLLDGMTPKFIGPDPCRGWEISEKMSRGIEDKCKEIRCLDAQVSSLSSNNNEEKIIVKAQNGKLATTEALLEKSGADDLVIDRQEKLDMIITRVSSMQREDLQSSQVYTDQTYKGLKQKIQVLQRTVNFLVDIHQLDRSSSFSDTLNSSNKRMSRSKSCRAVVVSTLWSSPYHEKASRNESTTLSTRVEKNSLEIPRDVCRKISKMRYDKRSGDTCRKYSQTSFGSSCGDASNLLSPWKSVSGDPLGRATTSAAVDTGGRETERQPEHRIDKNMLQQPSWSSEFEEKQRKIIELWDACNVSFIHRSYFIELFKGNPSDCLYMEIELRRLTFLKDSMSDDAGSQKDGLIFTTASSEKDLIRERGMLCKQIQSKSRKQREELYQDWGIDLRTKQRSLQLTRLIWSDTKDMVHVKKSAGLVAKLLGFMEPSQAPEEVVGLSILPRFITRKTNSWRLSLSSLF